VRHHVERARAAGDGRHPVARAVRRGRDPRGGRVQSGRSGGQRGGRRPPGLPARRAAPRRRDVRGDRGQGANPRRCALRRTIPLAPRRRLRPSSNRRVGGGMPARPRRLTHGGFPRVPPVAALAAAMGTVVMLAACAGVPSSPSRTPPPSSTPTAVTIVTPSPTAQLVGTTRTVLSPLG